MSEDPLLVTRPIEHVAVLTLDNPTHGNAIDAAMRRSLPRTWEELRQDDSVRAVVLTGAGDRHFCTGRDFKDRDREWLPYPHLKDFWKPVIVAINGVCGGSGHNFLWEADFAVASDRASFTEPHVSIGWVPAHEMLGYAVRGVPMGEIMQMGMRGKGYRMSAERALAVGIVTAVVPHEQLLERTLEIAREIAEQSPSAVRAFKEVVHRTLGLDYAYQQQAPMWQEILDRARTSPDHKEGPKAFVEARKPVWQ
jgi:E-phenylitaconyl-CoA hydratase